MSNSWIRNILFYIMMMFILIIINILYPSCVIAMDFYSGEMYHDNFVPFHSSELDDRYHGHVHSKSPHREIHCFEVNHDHHNRVWPILNKYKKIKPAPPAPKLDGFDSYYGPQAITSAPLYNHYFDNDDDDDDGYSPYADGDDDEDKKVKKEKVPFEICTMDCPSPNEGKPVCGDDGKTYDNIHKLNCAVRCGLRKL